VHPRFERTCQYLEQCHLLDFLRCGFEEEDGYPDYLCNTLSISPFFEEECAFELRPTCGPLNYSGTKTNLVARFFQNCFKTFSKGGIGSLRLCSETAEPQRPRDKGIGSLSETILQDDIIYDLKKNPTGVDNLTEGSQNQYLNPLNIISPSRRGRQLRCVQHI